MKSKEMEEQIEIKVSARGVGEGGAKMGSFEAFPRKSRAGRWRAVLSSARVERVGLGRQPLSSDDFAHLTFPSPASAAWERIPQMACPQSWPHNSKQDSQSSLPSCPRTPHVMGRQSINH